MMELRYTGTEPIEFGEWFKIEHNDFYGIIVDSRIKIKDPKGAVTLYSMNELRKLVNNSVTTIGDPVQFVEVWAKLNNVSVEILAKSGMRDALPDMSSESADFVYNYRLTLDTPKIRKSPKLNITLLEANEKLRDKYIEKLEGKELEVCERALEYTGFRAKANFGTFRMGKSDSAPTMFTKSGGGSSGLSTEPRLILNFSQLQGFCSGSLGVGMVAQAITHELAHYMMHDGIFKPSQAERYKKQLVARKLHPDQFHHAGYTNPWFHEAWATLCEYMVHGSSVRGLSCIEGWEYAEQYFDNNFLKNGIPSGDPLVKI